VSIRPQENISQSITNVKVSAPARLHLGFLDLNGRSGRKFGSIGLAIDSHKTTIEASLSGTSSHQLNVPHAMQNKIEALIANFYQHIASHVELERRGIKLKLLSSIPEHAGLGSGTQLNLVIGTALSQLHAIDITTLQIASSLGRGTRSGIGIATFDHGGFIIDGGLGQDSETPPLLARYALPMDWFVILMMEKNRQGVHGKQERDAFKQLPPFPIEQSHAICHLTLMKLLPGLIEKDINQFGQAITQIQAHIGDHFSSSQGGRYTSQKIAILLDYAKELGHQGIGQSSWGPTGCVFVSGSSEAQELVINLEDYIQKHFDNPYDYSVIITQASPSGAKIEVNI
jgi:beta-RFAP synthase